MYSVHRLSHLNVNTLKVNGREVGYKEDSKLEAEFDITRFLTPGSDNLIRASKANRWKVTARLLEDQDFWRLSGIGRDCSTASTPATNAGRADVRLLPTLGTTTATAHAAPKSPRRQRRQVRLTLRDDAGKALDTRTLKFPPEQRRNCSAAAPASRSAGSAEPHIAHGLKPAGSADDRDRSCGFPALDSASRIRDGWLSLVNGKPIPSASTATKWSPTRLLTRRARDEIRSIHEMKRPQHECRAHVPSPDTRRCGI